MASNTMSYRRNSDAARKWQTWSHEHVHELRACGIPLIVLENESDWFYFLDHGYFNPSGIADPIIDVDRMEQGQAERLCSFLESSDFYPNCYAVNRLQYRLKRGPHAQSVVSPDARSTRDVRGT